MVFVEDPGAPVLTSGDAHHLLDVLRLRTGEVVVASDGAGSWAPCRLAAPPPGRGSRGIDVASLLEPDGRPVAQPRLRPEITVAFAPTKGDRPEWVTAVHAGADEAFTGEAFDHVTKFAFLPPNDGREQHDARPRRQGED